ncbi:hypothetical protein K0U07_02405 [bacterium]|nr:hypothetical protein [bacterium]
MDYLKKNVLFLTLCAFCGNTLFAETIESAPMLLPKEEKKPVVEERLEEQIAPPGPPALIDLQQREVQKPKTFKDKYASLGLFLFNTAMFIAGVTVVKTLPGKKVHNPPEE